MDDTLYITDLDGTLLNSQAEVSGRSKEILNRLIRDKGILFSAATARTPATVGKLLDGIAATLPFIVMTGAALWHNGRFLHPRYFRPEETERLLNACRHAGIRPFLYAYRNGMLETYHSPETDAYEDAFIQSRRGTPYKRFVFSDRIPDQAMRQALLLFTAGAPGVLNGIYAAASAELSCTMSCYHDIYTPSVGLFEVMAEGVSKATALKELAAETGARRIVVFGDSANDLSMRSVADLFIAPANAADEVKKVADEVIGSNDDDCVARWIEQDCLNRT